MRYEFTTRHEDAAPRSAFERKWGLTGYTTPIKNDTIKVVVSRSFASDSSVRTALGHEVGHSTQVAAGAKRPGQMRSEERFEFEVDAWLREFPIGALSYLDATLMLDALNTYRRAYGVTDGRWQDARVRVEPLCTTKVIREYVPLEPDPNDEAMPCAGVGGHGGEDDDEGEAEDGGEGEGDESSSDESSSGDEDMVARDAWLHSQEGIDFTTRTTAAEFVEGMHDRGWETHNLPPVTRSVRGWIGWIE